MKNLLYFCYKRGLKESSNMKKIFIPLFLFIAFATLTWNYLSPRLGRKEWMGDQIQEDLSWYSKEDLNPSRIEASYNTTSNEEQMVHFQIKDNQIYWKTNWEGKGKDRLRKLCIMLSLVRKQKALPDVDFLITTHDGIITKCIEQKYLPIFTFAKKKGVHAILFPDPLSENFSRRERKRLQRARLKPQNYWKNKKEIAFWRGGTTGGNFLMNNWHQMPRTKLSLLTQYYPDIIDAGYSAYNTVSAEVKGEMLKCMPLADWTDHRGHLQYKYLVIADGNTCTYPRYYLGLCSGSVVLKDESEDIQWFYRALEPYKHYVPVAKDFSDLPEKVIWAKEHDKEAKKIAIQGQKFVKNNLLPKHIYQYISELLEEYASLQDAEVNVSDGMNLYTRSNRKKIGHG